MLLADVICHVVMIWMMFFAIVTNERATFVFTVEDEEPHLR